MIQMIRQAGKAMKVSKPGFATVCLQAALLAALHGCATAPVPTFVADGNRTDGRVVMATSTTAQPPIGNNIDWSEGIRQAEQTCRRWGYSGGRAVAGVTSSSQFVDSWPEPRLMYIYQRVYQCSMN